MKYFLLHGFYGQGNLGDEAILSSVLKHIGKNKLFIFSYRSKKVIDEHGVESFNPTEENLSFLIKKYNLNKDNSFFLLGGGNLLKDYGPNSSDLKKWLKLISFAKIKNLKTSTFAITAENIKYDDSKLRVNEVLSKIDMITVRDKISQKNLKDIGINNEIKLIGDPALLLTKNKLRKKDSRLKIFVCVRHWYDKGIYIEDESANNNFIDSLARSLDYIIEKYNAEIEFIPMRTIDYDNDFLAAKKIIDRMKNSKFIKSHSRPYSVKEFISKLDKCSLLIGMRLHSLILATGKGIPVISLEYMSKIKGYMDSIDQLKNSLDMHKIKEQDIINKFENILKNYDQISSDLLKSCSKLRKSTLDYFKEIGLIE